MKLVEVPLSRLPIIITMAPMPAALLMPILSARIPLGIASAASIISGMENIIPVYVIANDLYVFSWGLLMFKIAKSVKKKAITLAVMFSVFLFIHFALYVPMFPEFYWS